MTTQTAARPIARIVRSIRTNEGTEFMVNRIMPQEALPLLDPFVLLDEFGPEVPSGGAEGYEDHPHVGIEVISYMVEGEVETGDAASAKHLTATAGDVFWMRFGGGAVHYERPTGQVIADGGRCHALQLWVALPRNLKQATPAHTAVAACDIPVVALDKGGVARVLVGTLGDAASPVRPETEMLYLHLSLKPGSEARIPVPAGFSCFASTLSGSVYAGAAGAPLRAGKTVVFGNEGDHVLLATGDEPADLLLLAGRPTGEPIVRRAVFVMNSEEEIEDCFRRYMGDRLLGAAERPPVA